MAIYTPPDADSDDDSDAGKGKGKGAKKKAKKDPNAPKVRRSDCIRCFHVGTIFYQTLTDT
jgi:hypothetical protein